MSTASRIMIVEDDEIIANLISLMLEKNGYNIAAKISSGEEAVMKSADIHPDLVLMDINLNGLMDGITAARYIFSLFHFPVIFLTAFSDEQLVARAKVSQPYGYIMKPVTEKELVANIEIALHNHAIRRQFFDKFVVGDTKKIMTALDAMIITDTKGRLVFFNPYTCRLLEKTENDLMMKHSKDVLYFVNEQTGEQIRDPVPEVVKSMLVVSYEFNTVVLTKSGKQRHVGVTARPLKDEQDELIGVVIHIKEKTPAEIKMAKMM
jgi:PAS domain S-box-containing protein